MATNRHRRGGRTTPKGTQPARPRQDQARLDPMTALIQEGGDDLLRLADPLAAEVWASHTIGAFDQAQAESPAEDFELQVLERCRELRTPQAAVAARAMATMVSPPNDALARSVLDALDSVALPAWADEIGAATLVSAWTKDNADLLVFRQGDVDHGLIAAKTASGAHFGLSDHPNTWRADAAEAPVTAVCASFAEVVVAGDAGDRTDDFVDNLALVLARLRAITAQ